MSTVTSAASAPLFDPDFGSALDAAAAIRARRVSATELMRHTFDRVKRYNPALNAIVLQFEDEAMAAAREADQALARGKEVGPFHGVPATLKECLAWRETPTTAGLPTWKDARPKQDAICASRLAQSGAIVMGKTNVPLLLSDWQSYNAIYGTSNNPWDVTRTPGGSSGGTAAALAAGLGFLSIGSDIGGSIRVPSHFCGICGHKPSVNLIPNEGHVPPPPGATNLPQVELEVVGPMARHPRDLEQCVRVMAGPHGFDAKAYTLQLPQPRHRRLADFRVGGIADSQLCAIANDQREVLEALFARVAPQVKQFATGLPPQLDFAASFDSYGFLLGAILSGGLPDANAEAMRIAPNMGAFDSFRQAYYSRHRYFMQANSTRMQVRAAWEQYFRDFDVFLMPVAMLPAFPHQQEGEVSLRKIQVDGVSRDYFEMIVYPHFATVAGLPVTVVPAGRTKSGLPVGVQIIGPYLEDLTTLEFAALLEPITGGFEPPPGYSANPSARPTLN
jgi:amidase